MLQSGSLSTIPANAVSCSRSRLLPQVPLFQGTLIFAKRQTFEDLMEIFLRRLRTMPATAGLQISRRIVTGRPVHFAGANPDPALATRAL